MWIAGLAVIAAIAASYHLTRPPELVWWTCPDVGGTGLHVHLLIPLGWYAVREPDGKPTNPDANTYFTIYPVDRRPKLLQLLSASSPEEAGVTIVVTQSQSAMSVWPPSGRTIAERQ